MKLILLASLLAALMSTACLHRNQIVKPPAGGTSVRGEILTSAREVVDIPRMQYPAKALKIGERGQLPITVSIDNKGNVVKASKQEPGRDPLDMAALANAKKWKFSPAPQGSRSKIEQLKILYVFEFGLAIRRSMEYFPKEHRVIIKSPYPSDFHDPLTIFAPAE